VQAGGHDAEEAQGVRSQPLLRSMLFVPGDSERKQQKALGTSADALILDLEDSVAAAQLPAARAQVRTLLQDTRDRSKQQLWVRVNSGAGAEEDLVSVFPGAPDGVILPKVSSAHDIVLLSHYLSALEAREGRTPGATKLVAIVTETPLGLLNLPHYPQALAGEPEVTARLAALTWGMEDLSAALGALGKVDENGALTFTFQLARSLCLTTAAALGVQALDGVHTNFRDAKGLDREAAAARRDGFSGKLAIHPDQIAPINSAFTPTEQELARARRIVAAFAASPEAGVLNFDGEMIDRPHLLQARRILSLAERSRTPS
jgi:citrate lyase subunit beta / citryl-CoA lyase